MLRSTLCATTGLMLLSLLVACGGKSDAVDSGDSGDQTVMPEQGAWFGSERALKDGCDIELWDGASSVTITHSGSDSFSISTDGLYVSCGITGSDFACGPQFDNEDLSDFDLDAVIDTTIDISGTIAASSTEGAMRLAVSLSCEGPDCGELGEMMSLPCESVADYDLSHGG